MKRAWLPLLLALIGAVGPATAKEAADGGRQPVETARRYVDAFLAGDMQTLLDHAAPALKKVLKDKATLAELRAQSVGDGAQSGDEKISVTYNRRVKSAGGQAATIMAQVAPDGQLVAFSIHPAGKPRSKPLKYQTNKAVDGPRQPVEIARSYVDAFVAGDMQTLLDHASPELKQLMKDAAALAKLREQSIGNGAKSADEEIAITYDRRVKSAGGQPFTIVAELAPDGQLVIFSIEQAGETPSKSLKDPAEKSPFAAVRWQQSQPEVKVGDEWFKLVSLDGLAATEIVAFSRRTYRDRWQMRFEEDLVALLTAMGHPPRDKVTLVVQSLTSPQTQTLADVAMTHANRTAIKAAAHARERGEQSQPTRPAVSNDAPGEASAKLEKAVDVPAAALEKLVGSYELVPGLLTTVEAVEGKLMIGLLGQPPQQVFARSETVWFVQGVDATFTFNVGKSGKCDSLVLSQKTNVQAKGLSHRNSPRLWSRFYHAIDRLPKIDAASVLPRLNELRNLMEPDNHQQAGQSHASQTPVTPDADLLLKGVQRSQREFRAAIFFQDVAVIGMSLLSLPFWFYVSHTVALPWTWYLMAAANVWTIGFIVVYRMRHKQQLSHLDAPLPQCVERSLTDVDDQIWLQRNLLWWDIVPMAIPMLAFFAQVAWQVSPHWLVALGFWGFDCVVTVAVLYRVTCVNQHAVRIKLEPRRQELLALLASLGDQLISPVAGEYPILMGEKRVDCSPRRTLVAGLLLLGIVSILIASPILVRRYLVAPGHEQPGESPTAAARTLENVPTTDVNRGAIHGAVQAQELDRQQPATQIAVANKDANTRLAALVASLRKEKKLVGLAAMVMVDGENVASAVDGERKTGSGVPLQIGDRWHLGSITKSITATMIARLVEAGQMKFSDTIGEAFPDAAIHEDWKPVTLKQLLTHTAGAPANFSFLVALRRPALGAECTQARREAVLDVLAQKPEHPPGERFAYSNVGFTIAGAMAEKATGATWEDLVKREVFAPLALTSAGFGPPKSPDGKLPQPRGHRTRLGWKTAMDAAADNTFIIGPAGIVHMTLSDLCTYATEHLRGDRGQGKLLSAETYKLLHSPVLHDYACGWVRKEPNADIPHTVYWHNGSNTMWYALVVFIPDKNMVVAVTSNDGDVENAEAAAWEIVKVSAQQFNAPADRPSRERDEQPPATSNAVPISDAELFRTRIDEFLNAARTKAGFSGAVIVARGGQPVYQGAFGFSHLESKAPNTLDTPFRIASLSKQFTAAAIFRLESQGKLSIEDPVHRYLSEFAESPYRAVTIHHLLTHTSGLPRSPKGMLGSLRWNSMSQAATPVDDYVRLAVKTPLEFAAGTDFQYSNIGYRVLAALIARVTGREYADFMEQEIFQPLGMNDTGVARVTRPASEARIAEGLSFLRLDPAGEPLFANGEEGRNFGAGYGSGGIYTSANDLLRWDRVLAGDAFLSEDQKARLFQPIHENYACGWIVKRSGLDGRLYQMHNGANEGFFSQMMRLPDDDLAIIAVGNVQATPAIDQVLKQLFLLCRSLPYQDL